jgi:hypothetical protein
VFSLLRRTDLIARIALIALALATGSAASAMQLPCCNASLKGTDHYNESGVLNGKRSAESGDEIFEFKGGIVLSYSDSYTGDTRRPPAQQART